MRIVTPPGAITIPQQATRVFSGAIYDVYQWPQELRDGTTATFEMLKRPDTVKVLAIRDDKLVILTERPVEGGEYFNLPGGRHDRDDESELDAAKRELAEETGLHFKTWKLLAVKQAHPKIDYLNYLFLATDFDHETPPQADAAEGITIHYMTLHEAQALAANPKTRYVAGDVLKPLSSLRDLTELPAAGRY